jgi:hypothetical protein
MWKELAELILLAVTGTSQGISAPEIVGHFNAAGYERGVRVVGAYAYVACEDGGLRIVDVSVPSAPKEAGAVDIPRGPAWALDVSGTHAYVVGGGWLTVVDVSNSGAPRVVGAMRVIYGWNVDVVGTFVYVPGYQDGLQIIDASDPAAPREVGLLVTEDGASDVDVVGNTAYVVADEGGLRVIDVANPSAPRELGAVDTPGDWTSWVDVSGTHAYVTAAGSLIAIDVSDPAAPQVVAEQAYDYPEAVDIVGTRAYVVTFWGGFHVIDVSEPSAPREVATVDTPPRGIGVDVVGGYAYVTCMEGGLVIVRLEPAGHHVFLPNVGR